MQPDFFTVTTAATTSDSTTAEYHAAIAQESALPHPGAAVRAAQRAAVLAHLAAAGIDSAAALAAHEYSLRGWRHNAALALAWRRAVAHVLTSGAGK